MMGMTGNKSFGALAQYAHIGPDGVQDSLHTVPLETFVHYIDTEGTCLCGPYVAAVEHDGRVMKYYTHTWLDEPGSEDDGWDPDDFRLDDGPEDPAPGIALDEPEPIEDYDQFDPIVGLLEGHSPSGEGLDGETNVGYDE